MQMAFDLCRYNLPGFIASFALCMLSNHMGDVLWPMHTEIMFALFRGKFRTDYATNPFNLFIAIGTVLLNQYLFPQGVCGLVNSVSLTTAAAEIRCEFVSSRMQFVIRHLSIF